MPIPFLANPIAFVNVPNPFVTPPIIVIPLLPIFNKGPAAATINPVFIIFSCSSSLNPSNFSIKSFAFSNKLFATGRSFLPKLLVKFFVLAVNFCMLEAVFS